MSLLSFSNSTVRAVGGHPIEIDDRVVGAESSAFGTSARPIRRETTSAVGAVGWFRVAPVGVNGQRTQPLPVQADLVDVGGLLRAAQIEDAVSQHAVVGRRQSVCAANPNTTRSASHQRSMPWTCPGPNRPFENGLNGRTHVEPPLDADIAARLVDPRILRPGDVSMGMRRMPLDEYQRFKVDRRICQDDRASGQPGVDPKPPVLRQVLRFVGKTRSQLPFDCGQFIELPANHGRGRFGGGGQDFARGSLRT